MKEFRNAEGKLSLMSQGPEVNEERVKQLELKTIQLESQLDFIKDESECSYQKVTIQTTNQTLFL